MPRNAGKLFTFYLDPKQKKNTPSLKTKALESMGRKIKQNEPSFSPYPLQSATTNWFTFGVLAHLTSSSVDDDDDDDGYGRLNPRPFSLSAEGFITCAGEGSLSFDVLHNGGQS